MDSSVAQFNPWLVALLLALAMIGCYALGWYMGRRRPVEPDNKATTRFIDGSMALLGLFLAFTFSMALTKHDQRRLLVIADANAIADFSTNAGFLPEPHRTLLLNDLRHYVDLRLHILRDRPDAPEIAAALRDSEALQQHMTTLTANAITAGTPIAIPLANTLNELTSSHVSLLAAFHDRLPVGVLFLLFTAAIISTILVARDHGRHNKMHLTSMTCYILLVVLAFAVILDLNQPTNGLITITTEPLERLAAALAK